MPCVKVGSGYKIRRSKGGLYPMVYSSLSACQMRVGQMESHREKDGYERVVDRKMRAYGDIDLQKRKIRINPKKGDLVNTVLHEERHKKYPKKTEKQIRKMSAKAESKLSLKGAMRVLGKYANRTKTKVAERKAAFKPK